jgi:hypothetical protein
MRRLMSGVTAIALGLSGTAGATNKCATPNDQQVFDLAALKSELLVLAINCNDDADYNAFVNRYKPLLAGNEKSFTDYFKRAYGRKAQQEQDRYITDLANIQVTSGMRQKSDFCPHDSAIFQEVLALPVQAELAQYAAAKDLLPPQIDACPGAAPAPAAQAKVRKVVATKTKQN